LGLEIPVARFQNWQLPKPPPPDVGGYVADEVTRRDSSGFVEYGGGVAADSPGGIRHPWWSPS
jgi:hypothetical protein